MAVIRQPSSNVDRLEGAVEHMLMVCGSLTDAALDEFAQRYAFERGKKLPADFASKNLIPRMKRRRKVYQTGLHRYTINPMLRVDHAGEDAFWVFMEHMQGVDLGTVHKPQSFPQISYIKNNRIYHIVRCEEDGRVELSKATQREIDALHRKKRCPDGFVEERYFFIFSSVEDMKRAPFALKSPTIFGTISYEEGRVPQLYFINPAARAANGTAAGQ